VRKEPWEAAATASCRLTELAARAEWVTIDEHDLGPEDLDCGREDLLVGAVRARGSSTTLILGGTVKRWASEAAVTTRMVASCAISVSAEAMARLRRTCASRGRRARRKESAARAGVLGLPVQPLRQA
jgi:hypothetical protein